METGAALNLNERSLDFSCAFEVTRANTCPTRMRQLPGRRWRSVRGSVATRRPRRRSPSQDRFPSRCRQRSRLLPEYAAAGCRVLFAEHAAGGMLRGLRNLHGRLCPTHPEYVSAPCAKFDSIPVKIQQAKLLRTTPPTSMSRGE